MGAAPSTMDGSASSSQEGLGDLPEGCVASVLLYLDPPEICAAARLNRAFRGAAAADLVWERKLPPNYSYLLDKETSEGERSGKRKRLTRKEIYARLCRPIPFDGGTKLFWIDKCRGRICMSISSRALSITGIDDRRHWNFIPTEESRFGAVAYLRQIWWFEVGGEMDFCFPAGTYSLYFRLHLGRPWRRLCRRMCNMEHVHGWDVKPARFQVSTSSGQHALKQCTLEEPGKWIHYHVGDFAVEDTHRSTRLKFSGIQIDCTHTKGGVCVDSVLIYPRGVKPEKFFAGGGVR